MHKQFLLKKVNMDLKNEFYFWLFEWAELPEALS